MIEPCTVADLEAAPEFSALLDEYGAESRMPGLPPPKARMPAYRDLQDKGLLHIFRATANEQLIGLITVLAAPLPHYSSVIAVSESYFVGKAHRMSSAGMKLLWAAEAKAAELGSPVLLVSAPFGGKLFEVLPRLGYSETSRVFCKRVQ